MADRLAAEGYAVLVPNPFYRDVKGTVVNEDEDLSAAVQRFGSYLLRRQRRAAPETDTKLATYVTDRLADPLPPALPGFSQTSAGAPEHSRPSTGRGSKRGSLFAA